MNWAKRQDFFKTLLTVAWLLFTVTFAIWWFKFSVDHISRLAELQPEQIDHWNRQKRMVFWEGTAWVVLLAVGGGALIAFVQKEKLRVRRIREFFASFSHEIKTSLASLRLQAEALKDELGDHSSPILGRLIGDTVRLQVQLENSLFFASQDNLQLFVEPLQLGPLIERMREQWPNLNIELLSDCKVMADERALRSILGNLVQNAFVHGKAHALNIDSCALDNDKIQISVQDDGRGFDGDASSLGRLFHRPKQTSGSGLGLYICRLLIAKMSGQIHFAPSTSGFKTVFILKRPA